MEKTKENFSTLVEKGLTVQEIGNVFKIKPTTTRYWLSKFNLKTKFTKNKKKKWKDQDLINAIKSSQTKADTLRKIGLTTRPGNYDTLNKFISTNNIDISHFVGRSHGKSKPNLQTLENIMVENSSYSRYHLKNRIIREKIIPYKCEQCGLEDFWNGKKLVLVLDHKNGIGNDHRLENLRFLCPNCNSQQKTFCRRKKST